MISDVVPDVARAPRVECIRSWLMALTVVLIGSFGLPVVANIYEDAECEAEMQETEGRPRMERRNQLTSKLQIIFA